MGSSKKTRDRDRKKRKRDRSKSSHRHRHHHKHKKQKRSREERSPSIDLSDLSISDIEVSPHNGNSYKDATQDKPVFKHQEQLQQGNENDKSSTITKEISMSVEETNRIRAKLGLKPLVENVSIKTMQQANTETDYKPGEEIHNPPENLTDKLQIDKLREKIAAHRERRKYEKKITRVKGLGEPDEEISAHSWIAKSRRLEEERKVAEKKNRMLAELDDQFGIGDLVEEEVKDNRKTMYSSNSLSGLKVEHETSRFDDGHTTILTLKDSNVLDNDEDTLVNVNMIDAERVERNLRNKKINTHEYDTSEMDEYGNVVQSTVLEKYDEDIAGEQKKRSFRIGDRGEGVKLEQTDRKVCKMSKLHKLASLKSPSTQLATEYLTPGELVSFKKVKRKKKKRKMLKADDLEPLEDDGSNFCSRIILNKESIIKEDSTQEDEHTIKGMMEDDDVPSGSFHMEVDEKNDIELQEAITRSRRAKQENRDWPCENVVLQLQTIKDENESSMQELNVTMNITDEFCRTLGDIPTYGLSGNRAEEEGSALQAMSPSKSDDEKQGAWEEVRIENTKVEINNDMIIPILEEEPSAGSGVAMALELAKKKGYLEKDDSKKAANAALQHLRAVHYSIEDKAVEEDRRAGRDRYMGPITDFREKDGYRPDVKLEYVDDEGRKLCAKEAFRYLSHKFHGKGSGKNKLEKRMKKWKEDLNLKYMNSSDTPLQTVEKQREKQKELGTAYILLSGSKTQETLNVKK